MHTCFWKDWKGGIGRQSRAVCAARQALLRCGSVVCGFLFVLPVPKAAVAFPQTPAPAAEKSARAAGILPGSVLEIKVTEDPMLSRAYTVAADGSVTLRLADEVGGNQEEVVVSLKDRSVEEAATAISERLKRFFVEPHVTVVLARQPQIRVHVTGPVRRPGAIELPQSSRLSRALAAAECRPNADYSAIRILRSPGASGPGGRLVPVDLTAFMQGTSEDEPALENGDRIFIGVKPEPQPKEEPRTVTIRGEVSREAVLPLAPKMTLRDALQRAGGFKPTADRSKVTLIRASNGQVYPLDGVKAESGDPVHNIPLLPQDVILVNKRDEGMKYAVLGEVLHPSTFDYPADGKMTVLQALQQVGGTKRGADSRKAVLRKGFLHDPTRARDIAVDLDQVRKQKQRNWEIAPGDALIVPAHPRRPAWWQQVAPLFLRFLHL